MAPSEKQQAAQIPAPGLFWGRPDAREKSSLYDHLSNLMEGGVGILDALDSFAEKTPSASMAAAARGLRSFVSEGDPLSLGMKKMPDYFEKYEVSIAEAGENSGRLQSCLRDLAHELRKGHELSSKVKAALTYPTIIMVFLALAVVIVMAFVVPQLTPLFSDMGAKLPLSTQALIATSDFFSGNWPAILAALAACAVGAVAFRNSAYGREATDGALVGLPLVGDVYRNFIMSRIAANLAMLLSGGIPVVKAIKLAGAISGNSVYENVMDAVAQSVSEGKKISESITEADGGRGLFTLDFVQMVASGEKTSTIGVVGKRLSEQYEQEVSFSLAKMLKWVEPVAVLVAGLFVVWFAFSVYAAILEITKGVSNAA